MKYEKLKEYDIELNSLTSLEIDLVKMITLLKRFDVQFSFDYKMLFNYQTNKSEFVLDNFFNDTIKVTHLPLKNIYGLKLTGQQQLTMKNLIQLVHLGNELEGKDFPTVIGLSVYSFKSALNSCLNHMKLDQELQQEIPQNNKLTIKTSDEIFINFLVKKIETEDSWLGIKHKKYEFKENNFINKIDTIIERARLNKAIPIRPTNKNEEIANINTYRIKI